MDQIKKYKIKNIIYLSFFTVIFSRADRINTVDILTTESMNLTKQLNNTRQYKKIQLITNKTTNITKAHLAKKLLLTLTMSQAINYSPMLKIIDPLKMTLLAHTVLGVRIKLQ